MPDSSAQIGFAGSDASDFTGPIGFGGSDAPDFTAQIGSAGSDMPDSSAQIAFAGSGAPVLSGRIGLIRPYDTVSSARIVRQRSYSCFPTARIGFVRTFFALWRSDRPEIRLFWVFTPSLLRFRPTARRCGRRSDVGRGRRLVRRSLGEGGTPPFGSGAGGNAGGCLVSFAHSAFLCGQPSPARMIPIKDCRKRSQKPQKTEPRHDNPAFSAVLRCAQAPAARANRNCVAGPVRASESFAGALSTSESRTGNMEAMPVNHLGLPMLRPPASSIPALSSDE
jgi:hypothetical protein